MGITEIIIGAIGLLVAVWALNLQRLEIIRSGRINALVHTSNLLQEKIEYYQNLADIKKSEGEEWIGIANRANQEFKPLKHKIDMEFLELSTKYGGILHENEIKKALQAINANKAN